MKVTSITPLCQFNTAITASTTYPLSCDKNSNAFFYFFFQDNKNVKIFYF